MLTRMKALFSKLKDKAKQKSLIAKFYDLINHFSIRKRLIFFFLLVSLGPIAIIGVISYTSSRMAIAKKIAHYSFQGLSEAKLNIETKLKNFAQMSSQLSTVQNNTYIHQYVNAAGDGGLSSKTQLLNDLLASFLMMDDNIYAAIFIPADDPFRYILSTVFIHSGFSSAAAQQFVNSFIKSDIYKNVQAANGDIVWSLTDSIKAEPKIIMAQQIKDLYSGDSLGTFLFLINEKSFNIIFNYQDLETGSSGVRNDETLVIDNKGKVVVSSDKDKIGENLAGILSDTKQTNSFLSSQKNWGSFVGRTKEDGVSVTYASIEENGWYILNIAPASYLYAEIRMVGWITLILGLLFGFIAIVISLYVTMSISHPLNQVVAAIQWAEKGDFTVNTAIKRKDELGYLGASFDRMVERISSLLKDTKEAIDAVLKHSKVLEESSHQSAQASESIAAAMEEITKGTMEQTNETELSTAKMSELAKQIEAVTSQTNEVEQISGSTRELSIQSKEAVEHLIIKTNEASQISETIIKDIIDLNVNAEEIRGITEIITNIAEQTNLLALNAAIEAARAGESGKGFAVVADEVNKLALQFGDSAKTINNILHNIQIKTQNSSKTAELAQRINEEQKHAVEIAEKSFVDIIKSTSIIMDKIGFVNTQINSINNNKDHAVQSIVNISAISEQTAASAQEVSASSQEQTALAEQVRMLAQQLHQKADELSQVIAKFHINM